MNDQNHNYRRGEGVRYFPDTDTLHIDLTDEPIVYGDEQPADVFMFYDRDEILCGRSVEFASKHPWHVTAALRAYREKLGYTVDR